MKVRPTLFQVQNDLLERRLIDLDLILTVVKLRGIFKTPSCAECELHVAALVDVVNRAVGVR